MGGGNTVGCGYLGEKGVKLGGEGLQALRVAEGPAHVAEPLAAEAIRREAWCVGGVDRQGFACITECGFEGGRQLDKVVARGTKTV